MQETMADLLANSIKLYALMTPPAVLSAFLGQTKCDPPQKRHFIALKTSLAIFIIGSILYTWGARIFEVFGFTLDAFRIGSGVLLLLTAIDLMHDDEQNDEPCAEGDISIVPLAIPLGMGPASIGAVMVMGAQANDQHEMLFGLFSLFLAALSMYLLLRMGEYLAKILHTSGIAVLSKLTGLILAAIAAQVIFTGVVNFLN